jgi:hypothetical protein
MSGVMTMEMREARTRAGVRLTRRGRLVAFVSSLAMACAVFGAFAGSATGSGAASERPMLRTITVQPGDTLWGIAREVAPGEDPREVIAEIESLNSSVGAVLQAGDELVVPVDH